MTKAKRAAALTIGTSASTTATTTASVDSATTIILIDSINNNNYNNNKPNNNNVNTNFIRLRNPTPATTTRLSANGTTLDTFVEMPTATTPNGNTNDVNGDEIVEIEPETTEAVSPQPRPLKRLSLLNFKSLDLHLKSFYSGLRGKSSQSQSSSLGGATTGGNVNGSDSISIETPPALAAGSTTGCRRASTIHHRMPPYLKIEAVDSEESENLLLDYPQSPYSSRRNSSPQDNNRSSTQLLNIDRYEMTRSQATSPSPYYLSPYSNDPANVRRSSTSDIVSCKRSGSSSTSDSRRPSTSDLLRRARERRGSEARMGRSVSHSGIPRGGRAGKGGGGGRRTSIAF